MQPLRARCHGRTETLRIGGSIFGARWVPLLCGWLLSGCAAKEPEAPPPERLVAWHLLPEAGSSQPLVLGIHDRELATTCRFVTAPDGVERCLPFAAAAGPVQNHFADSRCEHMLFQWTPSELQAPGSAEPPKYLSVPSGPDCAPVYVPHTARRFEGSSQVFIRSTGGGCTAYSASVSASFLRDKQWLVADELVQPSLFASGRRVQVPPPADQRLGVEQIVSDSGGPFVTGLYDTKWQRACTLSQSGSADTLSCLPPFATSTVGRYRLLADRACTTRLAADPATDESCVEPVMVRGTSGWRSIGARWTTPYYYSYDTDGIGCQMDGNGPRPKRVYAIGAELEPDAISTVGLHAPGAGLRLVVPRAADGRSFALPVERWGSAYGISIGISGQITEYRGSAETSCTPMRVSDGTIRCLPFKDMAPLSQLFFADAACSVPLLLCDKCEGKTVLVPAAGGDPFGAASAVRKLGPRFTRAAFTTGFSNDHKCVPLDPAMNIGGELRELAEPIPWEEYARLQEWRGSERIGH